jgi:1-acyl-sn-glycerol-3-phosphate acyltransferase
MKNLTDKKKDRVEPAFRFRMLYSILAWITMAITSIIITPFFLLVWVTTFRWDRRGIAAHFMGTFWAWHYQSLVPFWKLTLEGREKVPRKRPVVLVSNHRSLVDILALYKLRRPFVWTSKAENFRLPFVGMVLRLTNAIPIRRESLRSGSLFIAKAESAIKNGSSVLLFPEGTRAKTKTMRPFKEGAFLLASRTGSGIIPMVISGSENTFPGGKPLPMGRARVRIRVLEEIPPEKVKELEIKALIELVRQRMEDALKQLDRDTTR